MKQVKRLFTGNFTATEKLFIGFSFIVAVGLFLYSFTQIDLSLTLSRMSFWQVVQKSFQLVGYFNRPLSTGLYIVLLVCAFGLYGSLLRFVQKGAISQRAMWVIVILVTGILMFSYAAFSYDIFNYIFDAKIVTYYQQNPYEKKALDFPADPMLSFMHWTHRTYPYGPVWLLLTVPLSFLGFQVFLLTYFLFKILIAASYLGIVYFISRILRKISPKDEVFGMALFALNPLVLIESLLSAHNDIVMMFFAVWGIYQLINKKYLLSFVLFIISYGIKFATESLSLPIHIGAVVFLAAAVYYLSRRWALHPDWERVFIILSTIMIFPVLVASYRTNFQPWYLLYVIPFAALVGQKFFIFIPMVIFSLFALLQYVPFLYIGNWNPPVPSILSYLTITPAVLSLAIVIFCYFRFARNTKKA